MEISKYEKEYRQFQVDLLNSKFKGTHTEREMVERLIKLCDAKNPFALRGLEATKLVCAPDSRMKNSIWDSGAIYHMAAVETPEQTGPQGTDNFGLWRYSSR
jgi:hypothetical protein